MSKKKASKTDEAWPAVRSTAWLGVPADVAAEITRRIKIHVESSYYRKPRLNYERIHAIVKEEIESNIRHT